MIFAECRGSSVEDFVEGPHHFGLVLDVLSYFNIAPTSHTSDINVDRACLICGLMMKMDMDLGNIISQQITQIASPVCPYSGSQL